MNVVVIYGGKSGEHEVSLVSAASVARNIGAQHTISLIGIDKDGRWFLQGADELARVRSGAPALQITRCEESSVLVVPGGGVDGAFRCGENVIHCDIVFPVLHGTYGEDGTIQGLLEMAEVPYVGCGVMESAVTMDKEKTKQLWERAGLPVVPYLCLCRNDIDGGVLSEKLNSAEQSFGYPLFIKPCCAGSSVGAGRARNRTELEAAVAEAFRWDNKILVEQSVDAREVECSVTGNTGISSSVKAYIPGEIVPSHDFYDYDAKYTDPNGARLCIPALLDTQQIEHIRETAVRAFEAAGCSGLARVDFFIDRTNGAIYLNELNTMPGFTSISMFPKMCSAAGLEYSDLIQLLIDLGLERFEAHRSLTTDRG